MTDEPLDQIRITGVSAFGHHGLFEHERREGQMFSADVDLLIDSMPAGRTGDLEATADYGAIAEQVHAILSGDPVDLIETVAERIATACLAHQVVRQAVVTVHKPEAPIQVPFGDVAITVIRPRRPRTSDPGPPYSE